MPFLRLFDYYVTIQPQGLVNLTKAVSNAGFNATLMRINAEARAQAKITEWLVPKYDLKNTFTNTLVYAANGSYGANQLVELNAVAYSPTTAYIPDQQVSWTDGNLYQCISGTTGNAPPNSTYWEVIGLQNDMYYIPYPYPLFDLECGCYNVGDRVYWKGKIYQCQQPTQPVSDDEALQHVYMSNVPEPNVFPDAGTAGLKAWGTGTPYTPVTGLYIGAAAPAAWSDITPYPINEIVSSGSQYWQSLSNSNTGNTPGADIINWQPVSWVNGDNRDAMLVANMVHLALFYIYMAISPQNIPELRLYNYKEVEKWLDDIMEKGKLTIAVAKKQPSQGGDIRFGGETRRDTAW